MPFSGNVETIPLDEVIQFIATNSIDGMLTVAGGGARLTLHFFDGQIFFPFSMPALCKAPQPLSIANPAFCRSAIALDQLVGYLPEGVAVGTGGQHSQAIAAALGFGGGIKARPPGGIALG